MIFAILFKGNPYYLGIIIDDLETKLIMGFDEEYIWRNINLRIGIILYYEISFETFNLMGRKSL